MSSPRIVRRALAVALVAVVVATVATAGVASVLAGSTAGAATTAEPSANDWSHPHHDARYSGFNPHATGPTTEVGPTWVTRVGSVETAVSPTVADGTVYVGNRDGRVVAMDAETGRVDWRANVEGVVTTAAAVGPERAFVVAQTVAEGDGTEPDSFAVVAVDRETGEVDWRYPLAVDGKPYVHAEDALTYADGRVFVAAFAGGRDVESASVAFAVDAASGEEVWRHVAERPGEYHLAAPVVADGVVYLLDGGYGANRSTYVTGVDAARGDEVFEVALDVQGQSLLYANGTAYVVGDALATVDVAANGTPVVGRVDGVNATPFERVAIANGTLYAAVGSVGSPSAVAAYDLATGAERWRAPADYVDTAPAVTRTMVVVGTLGEGVVAFDRDTGERLWSQNPHEHFGVDRPVAVVNDTVYLYAPWHVYALGDEGTAVAGGFLGALGDLLQENAALGLLVGTLATAALVGVGYGLVVVAAGRFGLSRSPPTFLAARLFRTAPADVSRGKRVAAGLVASVAVAFAYGVLGSAATLLAPLLSSVGLPGGLLFVLGPVTGVVAGVFVVGGAWWLLVNRVLPADESLLDAPLATVRREWALVHVGYLLALAVVYPFVQFIVLLLVFRPI
ncbi:PQQ-binding-like beta-propeller repeat protein [Halorubellus litoreus]|uniref:PQQ-binding-like beta-propeller repeat protein n=1 Tax=Halorubellus litoreus TaxID=755308 RepID=A0ABD5VCA7_9EURY